MHCAGLRRRSRLHFNPPRWAFCHCSRGLLRASVDRRPNPSGACSLQARFLSQSVSHKSKCILYMESNLLNTRIRRRRGGEPSRYLPGQRPTCPRSNPQKCGQHPHIPPADGMANSQGWRVAFTRGAHGAQLLSSLSRSSSSIPSSFVYVLEHRTMARPIAPIQSSFSFSLSAYMRKVVSGVLT